MKTKYLTGLLIVFFSMVALAGEAKPAPSTANEKSAELMKKILSIKVGTSTRADVANLLGQPWHATNDADCQAMQYGEIWEYVASDAQGPFRIHVAFSEDGKASLVARIRKPGSTEVLAFIPPKAGHQH